MTKTIKSFGPGFEEAEGTLVEWSEELEIGVDVIDQQHLRYFELVNRYLEQAAEYANTQDTMERLVQSFGFMRSYAEEHFDAERAIMEETGYPDIEAHRAEHRYFKQHISDLSKQMEETGFSPALAREVNFYAVEWFIQHILSVDARLARFLKEKNMDDGLDKYAF